MKRRRWLTAGAIAAMLLVAASATATTYKSNRARKSVLIFGVRNDAVGFNTALACCNSLEAGLMGAIESGRGAFLQDNRGVWVKDIVTEASATRRTLSYTIRPNAYWYWGGKKVPVTYKDFVYTLRKLDDPSSLVASRLGYGNLDPTRFTHKGLKEVTFFWKTRNCTADFPCGAFADWQSIFATLYPSAALAGEDFNTIWTNCICGRDGKPVSDGPFYLSSYTRGQGTTLKANPFFYGKKPGLAEVDMKVFTNTDAEVQALRGGEIDAAAPPFGSNLVPLKNIPGITFTSIPGYYFEHVEFRMAKGTSNVLLRAPWMREAIALGIDRQGIIDTLYGELAGTTKPMNNAIYYSTEKGYKPDFARWNYNPAKALAILGKHCTGGPGATWQCSGLPARFRWTWTGGIATRTTIAEIAKAELKSIGIELIEDPLPTDLLFAPTGLPSGNFDAAEFADITTGDPGDWYDSWRCNGPGNLTGYCSSKVSKLMRAGNAELDPAKRAADFQAADKLMADSVPVLPLYQRPIPLIYRSNILGMVANPGIFGPVWNIQDWRWRS
jgi:peptide/nickel transport system substrate-binding protein